MYIHFDFSQRISKDTFPLEFGKLDFGFYDDTATSKNNYFLDNLELFDNGKASFGKLGAINFFVGANNSGKSRFLRGLFKVNSFKCTEQSKSVLDLFFELQEKSTNIDTAIFFELSEGLFGKNLSKIGDLFGSLYQIEDVQKSVVNLKEKINDIEHIQILDEILNFLKELKFHSENYLKKKIYIPILRSIIYDSNLNKDSFNKIYEIKYGLKENVFTGLMLFDNVFELHNSADIIKLEKFTLWLQDNFYQNEKLQLIPDKANSNLLLKIGDEMHPIFNIGDGIQQLILLLFPIFTSDNDTWCFIEEPETHLHPGLQRIFIETLLNNEYLKSKNLRYFFTTHSNHFLDLSLHTDDISIFQFHKGSQEKFMIKNVKPNKETLDLLGVNNSSVLMANSSIWVEGPTDRKYISFFLKLYCTKHSRKHLKEDIDFAFFEYGGNLIEHYLFDENFEEVFSDEQVREKINSFAISNKIYLLADNDNATGKKLKRREELEKTSEAEKNFKYQNTNYREIENLLPIKIIKDFLVELVNSSEEENVNKISFDREDYISIGLGQFITDLFVKNKINDFKKFKGDSGTLKSSYKTKLCEFVINGDYSYPELIENNNQLDDIISDLYQFIN
ncbi:ATP-dependent nuclease [Flavobacterium sp. CF136]|uniref:ATP-dependent nuclease n=1 Tax=Flavobacterium sp. (strain CF136) TaxID=1144313 RepID=UPI00027173CD|nr:ATP-binding protein [Flavobacterium sp. CF136]EJL65015.1 putative ATP-dependent endonuclease of the OLD family [Flavobacterium sp. CF136]